MRRWLLVALISGCGATGPARVGTQPSWRHPSEPQAAAPAMFAPTTQAASSYNEPAAVPVATPLSDAVLAAVHTAAQKANVAAPVADARLYRACEELAEIVPEDGVVDYGLEAFALQRNGIIEPSPHLVIVWGDLGTPGPIVEQLEPLLGEMLGEGATRVGVGAAKRNSDGTGAVVFALASSHVTTHPIARAVAPGGSFPIDATIDAGFHDPELFVTRDDGTVERIDIAAHGSEFRAAVACGKHAGRQQIEITASNTGGSTVLANFPVWCGGEPPVSMKIDATTDDTPVAADEAERRLLALLDRDRQAAGLPALIWDDRVAAVARGYSEEMRKTKVVAHISPISGSATDRVHAAGIKTAVVLENVAREYGVAGAHAGLMNSPGHRANLMSTVATHVGIGVVYGDEVSGRREMFVTQVFIRIPPKVDAAKTAELVRQRIDQVRPVTVDVRLASVAQEVADGLASGKTRDQLWPTARKKLDTPGYARIGSVITAVADLDSIDGKELVGEYRPDAIGVGIAQGMHPEIGEGAIWIVVLLAERGK